jgi:calcineurin-like phosphoesterase family protein
MNKETWLVSDTHFGHVGATKFFNFDGTKMRPWDDPDEMDEALVKNWNDSIRPGDKVYHLGDVVMPQQKNLNILRRLNGEKILIRGNHDNFPLSEYALYFKDVRGAHELHKCILTHFPVHPGSKYRYHANIHGHLHGERVMFPHGKDGQMSTDPDPWYINVSIERTNFAPILFTDVLKMVNPRK